MVWYYTFVALSTFVYTHAHCIPAWRTMTTQQLLQVCNRGIDLSFQFDPNGPQSG